MMIHPLWLAPNLMTHPFVRAQNLVTHPPFAPTNRTPPPLILIDHFLTSFEGKTYVLTSLFIYCLDGIFCVL